MKRNLFSIGLLLTLSTEFSASLSAAQTWQDDRRAFKEAGFVVVLESPGSGAEFTAYSPSLPEFQFEASHCEPDGSGCQYSVYFAERGLQGKLVYKFDSSQRLEITSGTEERSSEDLGCTVVVLKKWINIEYSKSSVEASSTFETFRDSPCGEEHVDLFGGIIHSREVGVRRYYFRASEILFDPSEIDWPPMTDSKKGIDE